MFQSLPQMMKLMAFLMPIPVLLIEQKFLREPPDQTAAVGEHVTLPCRVEHKMGNIQWTRDDFGLGLNRNLKGFDRYRMSGSDEEGDYTLDIDSVTLTDDAQFQCQVGAAPGVAPVRSRYATLTVTVPPESPKIINGKVLRTQEDRVVTLECVSRGGKPAAEITWLDNFNIPIKKHIETIVETLPDGKRKNTKSILKLVMKKTHHNTSLTCEAQNSAESSPRKTTILLQVEFAPAVSLEHKPEVMKEGDTVIFRCLSHSNPETVTYQWFVGGKEQTLGENVSLLVLPGVDRLSNGAIVKCQVRNSIGKSEETHTLDIYYNPEFIKKPEDVSADSGQEILLACQADGNPSPSYRWFRNGDTTTVIGYSSNLTVFISESTIGTYTCHVAVKGYQEIQESAQVYRKGPPKILKSPESSVQYGSLGETAQLVCDSFAMPVPETMVWKYNDYPVNSKTEHYQVLTQRKKAGVVSTLVIKDSVTSDFGSYNCSVKNAYGEDFQIVELQRRDSSLLLVVLVGVVSGAILILATLLVFLHWRRLRHKSYPDPGVVKTKQTDSNEFDSEAEYSSDQEDWQNGTQSTEKTDSNGSNPSKNGFHSSTPFNGSYQQNGNGHAETQKPLGSPMHTYLRPNVLQGTPERPSSMISYPNIAPGDLNVTNPRYAAKYGNPYLRESPTMFDSSFPPPPPHIMQPQPSPLIIRSQFSTTNPRQNAAFDGYNTQVPKFGTMPNNSLRKVPPNPPFRREQPIGGAVPAHYIQAQDGLTNGRLATHV